MANLIDKIHNKKYGIQKNKDVTQWMANPKNYENGLRLLSINNTRVPIVRPCCEICTDMKIWKNINKLSDEKMQQYVQDGKLHGLKRPLCVFKNKVYHKKCLLKKLGDDTFNEYVKKGLIISE